jgi:UDP-N-acetyl-2-amino-2-deoxyglucuronate dehydrogenase
MKNNVIRFALVGCGRIAKKHADAITNNNHNNSMLSAVCDNQADRAKSIGTNYGVPFYTSYDEMISNHPEIDVVNILTESGNHSKHTCDIVKTYQKHIVVEKPMALTMNDADLMIKTCDKYGVKLFVVKQNRYNLPVLKLKDAIRSNRFGKLVMGSVRVRWSRNQAYYDQDAWRGTWKYDGGVFTNQASHHIDLLEWMLGEPISVFAKSTTALADIETEDTGVAIIQFEDNVLGVVEATTATRPVDLEGSLSILGENGSVVIGGFAVNELQTWKFNEDDGSESSLMKENSEIPPNVYGFGHTRYLENVCAALLHNEQALVDGLEGRKSLKLIHAIYESIETGKEVMLRYQPKTCKLGL